MSEAVKIKNKFTPLSKALFTLARLFAKLITYSQHFIFFVTYG
jgi:hypothetical protein